MRIDRRQALRWIGAAAAAATAFAAVPDLSAQGRVAGRPNPAPGARRIGWDPVLNKDYQPGELWPLTLSDKQRRAAAALCDLIIPPEPGDKAPSALGVQDFIDEWVSSPYDETAQDRSVIVAGLDWLDEESRRRHEKDFADADEAQRCRIADDICGRTPVKKELKSAHVFFGRFRFLAASGYYTTPQGWKDIGYVGNTPMAVFPGPSAEALKHLGLA